MPEIGPRTATRSSDRDEQAVAPGASVSSTSSEFDRFYFEHYKSGRDVPYRRDEGWLEHFDLLAKTLVRELEPTSVLDAGCALGLLVERLRARGVDAWGIDISEYAIAQVGENVRPYCRVGSVTEPLPPAMPDRYDLVTCIEVLEHLPAEATEAAIENLCSLGTRVLFSSAPDDFAEATHVNLRPTEEWSALFARTGFFRVADFDTRFLSPWAVLYERRPATLSDVVRTYDRTTIRLVAENAQLRELAIDLERRIAEFEASDFGRAMEELASVKARLLELERELIDARRLLETRSGRVLRAYHAARAALRIQR